MRRTADASTGALAPRGARRWRPISALSALCDWGALLHAMSPSREAAAFARICLTTSCTPSGPVPTSSCRRDMVEKMSQHGTVWAHDADADAQCMIHNAQSLVGSALPGQARKVCQVRRSERAHLLMGVQQAWSQPLCPALLIISSTWHVLIGPATPAIAALPCTQLVVLSPLPTQPCTQPCRTHSPCTCLDAVTICTHGLKMPKPGKLQCGSRAHHLTDLHLEKSALFLFALQENIQEQGRPLTGKAPLARIWEGCGDQDDRRKG